jgi:hypothetical protein
LCADELSMCVDNFRLLDEFSVFQVPGNICVPIPAMRSHDGSHPDADVRHPDSMFMTVLVNST